ncbi:MAG: SAM-dependent methyltransferase, partial [Ktedonobacterales bacterium]
MAEQREIVVVGLGPGRWEDLTIAARDILESAPRVVFRTLRHPTVDALRARNASLAVESFDALYEQAESFAQLYPQMADRLYILAAERPDSQPLIYAVPGHPLIAEESVRYLRLHAPEHGVVVRIVPGLSFIEPVSDALDVDPLSAASWVASTSCRSRASGSQLS